MNATQHDVALERPVPRPRSALLVPFRSRDFRLLWFGMLCSNLGTWMQFTTLGYLVVKLAGTPRLAALDVGILGASSAIPAVLFSPLGGVAADRFPRRRVLFVTNGITSVLAFAVFVLIGTGHAPIWTLMITSGLQAATQSFDAPARQSWVPVMVPREYVGGAIGLNSVAFNGPSVIGPPLAGLLIAAVGVAPCFLVNAVTTLAVVVALAFMQPAPPSSTRRGNVLAAILEGVRFLIVHPVLRWVVLLLVVSSVTIRPYNFLLPAYAVHVVHTDAKGLGLLMAATGVGAICGAFFTAATGSDRRGSIWIASAVIAALGIVGLGLTPWFGVAALSLCVVGLATLSFIGSSNILLQTLSPDDMRGRVISVYGMILLGFVPLGSLLLGALASLMPMRVTFVLGGAISAGVALWIAIAQPAVRDA